MELGTYQEHGAVDMPMNRGLLGERLESLPEWVQKLVPVVALVLLGLAFPRQLT